LKRLRRIFKIVIVLSGAVLGVSLVDLLFNQLADLKLFNAVEALPPWLSSLIYLAAAVICGLLAFSFSEKILNAVTRLNRRIQSMPTRQLVSTILGFIVGLIIAFLLRYLVLLIPTPWAVAPITVLLYIALGFMGASFGHNKLADTLPGELFRRSGELSLREGRRRHSAKVVDTSTIIDGRIYDVLETGFLEGPIIIPTFVLTELQHVSDSADDLKRARGRRGLDIVARMQKDLQRINIEILSRDYPDIAATDDKLLALAKELGAKIITNDFNLNKVASVQGIEVLNINVLANAVKQVTLPGEQMTVRVIREGKEAGQGVAFMADGTMIVIEGAQGDVGSQLTIEVTSSLQTPAGRMVFARKVL